MEIHRGLVRFLTAVPLGGAAGRAVDQRVSLGRQPGRHLIDVQRVEVAHAVIRPGRRLRTVHPIVHSVHPYLVIVFASRRERLRSLREIREKKR